MGKPGFVPGPVHVRCVLEKVALGQVCRRAIWFFPISVIPPVLHIPIYFICHRHYRPVMLSQITPALNKTHRQ